MPSLQLLRWTLYGIMHISRIKGRVCGFRGDGVSMLPSLISNSWAPVIIPPWPTKALGQQISNIRLRGSSILPRCLTEMLQMKLVW